MKLKHILTLGAMAAALALGTSNLMAQDDTGGGANGGNGNGGIRGGGNGGGGFGGGGGGRNFDPAARQQMMMQGIQERLGFTNDTDWQAVQPLVQKVLDARRDVGGPNMRAIFGGRNRGGGQGGGGQGGGGQRGGGGFGGFGGQPSQEETALQDALDNNAPAAQVKDLLAKFKAAQKAKQAKLAAAQEDLKKVLTSKQEAQAYMWGLVD